MRNVGSGVAVLHGWRFHADPLEGSEASGDVTNFDRLTRDIFTAHGRVAIDVLYGDFEGGQRTITRFGLFPHEDGGYLASVARQALERRP